MKLIRILSLVYILSLLIIVGCDKNSPNCVEVPRSASYTVNAFDENDTTSSYFGKNIANFVFTESTTTYTGVGSCPSDNCGISLQIENMISKKITFNYTIGLIYNNGASVQYFQGTASIADSTGTFNVGNLSNDCSVVTAPITTVQLSKISYN